MDGARVAGHVTPSGFLLAETSPRSRAYTGTISPQHLPSSGQASQPGQLGCIITYNRIFLKSSVDTPRREILKTMGPSFQKSSLQFSLSLHRSTDNFTFQPQRFVANPQGDFHRNIRTLFHIHRNIRTLFSFFRLLFLDQARTRVLIFSCFANLVSIVKTLGNH